MSTILVLSFISINFLPFPQDFRALLDLTYTVCRVSSLFSSHFVQAAEAGLIAKIVF